MKTKPIEQISQNESRMISIDETELSIFDARRYFSGSNDPKDQVEKVEQQKVLQDHTCNDFVTYNDQRVVIPPPSPVSSVDGYGGSFPGARSSSATASVSEASWNSRTGLLMMANAAKGSVSLKNISSTTFPSNDHRKIKRTFAAKKWLLDRKSNCCIGKKAVRVKEVELESENTMPDSIKTGKNIVDDDEDNNSPSHSHLQELNNLESTQETLKQRVSAKGRPFIDELRLLSFPVNVNSNSIRVKDKNMGRKSNATPLEDSPRKSLEVFRALLDLSSVLGPKNVVRDRALFDPRSPVVGVTNVDDDMWSDASSDLFEIESLSAPTSSNSMYCRRDYSVLEENPNARRFTISAHGVNVTRKVEFDMKSLDESRAASERIYLPAPSEVSIDWSVATADGLDKASVTTNISAASASEIGRADILGPRPQKQEEVGGGHGGWRKGNGLLLMGCREYKAVSVGPQPVFKRVALGQRI
ncbi:uncharacterized protein [Henckelia pumila]|uniref:uncharacterized protein n=1 Tax=Henckelia pumila TaxID=405737 RepID=UPI003C6DB8EE